MIKAGPNAWFNKVVLAALYWCGLASLVIRSISGTGRYFPLRGF
jgi:hypothetical protein